MCGILGGFRFKNSYSFRDLESLRKRGPDSIGTWHGNDVFMGLSRLGIIDPGHDGDQPMENDRYVIAYNGELYNFMEIKKTLQAMGVAFRSRCDTEVVLEAITFHGTEIIKTFRGFWAFALYDKKERKFLLCRDHFGIKPLYYYHNGDRFCFSSMLRTISEACPESREADHSVMSEYVKYQFTFDNGTFFKKIRKVRPGEIVTFAIDDPKVTSEHYFTMGELRHPEVTDDELRGIIQESVAESVVSDVPLTTFCSGGIDSSLVTLLTRPEVAYHANFSDPDCNETRYARQVVDGQVTRLMVVNAEEEFSLIEKAGSILEDFDELSIGSVILPLDDIMKLIHKRYRLVMNGSGGDELFFGYARYHLALGHCPFVSYQSLFSSLAGLDGVRNRFEFLHTKGKSEFYNFFDTTVTDRFMSEFDNCGPVSDLQKMRLFDMKNFLPGLLNIEDKLAARYSIENRPPFLNQRIVRAVLAADPKNLFSPDTIKPRLKRIFSDLLPREILDRKDKMGFTTPIGDFVNRSVDEIREQLVYSKYRDWYDIKRVNFTVDSKWDREVFGILLLDLWLNRYLG